MKSGFVLLYLCYCVAAANGANILGFFPLAMRSHYVFVKPLLAKLTELGHNLTIYTVHPSKSTESTKFREIDMKRCLPSVQPIKGTVDDLLVLNNLMTAFEICYNFQPKSSRE